MRIASRHLVNVLIAKSVVDTVLVTTITVVFFVKAFPPYFHGWGEATPDSIAGWVVNDAAPWDRVEVQLFIDNRFVDRSVANRSRPDVQAAGWSKDEWHGYSFMLPQLDAGIHEARVYAVHMSGGGVRGTLQLVGDPIRFHLDEKGTLTYLVGQN